MSRFTFAINIIKSVVICYWCVSINTSYKVTSYTFNMLAGGRAVTIAFFLVESERQKKCMWHGAFALISAMLEILYSFAVIIEVNSTQTRLRSRSCRRLSFSVVLLRKRAFFCEKQPYSASAQMFAAVDGVCDCV